MSQQPEDEADGGRLSGWSRRKLAARRGEGDPPREAEEAPVEKVADVRGEPDGVDEEYIAALPPIDTIGDGSDIKPFLARGVPASLKNTALRRLWSATPGVRDYSDPAVDYAWDWNAPGGVPGGGGTLSESAVAKMVKNLIGESRASGGETAPVQDVADARDADTDPERREVETVLAAPEIEAPPAAIRRTKKRDERAEGGKTRRPDAQDETRQAAASIAPPRAHGGAVPD